MVNITAETAWWFKDIIKHTVFQYQLRLTVFIDLDLIKIGPEVTLARFPGEYWLS